jgi:hypothetical protein
MHADSETLLARNLATNIALKALFASLDSAAAAKVRQYLVQDIESLTGGRDADKPLTAAVLKQLNTFNALLG